MKRTSTRYALLLCVASIMSFTQVVAGQTNSKLPPPTKKQVDFVGDVLPILRKNCVSCHGKEAQEGELRLDVGRKALQGGDSGKSIIPGKSADSRLIQLVAGTDKDGSRMPPEGEGAPLSKDDVALLRAWIDQGAKWPEAADAEFTGRNHWAFGPIQRPTLPPIKQSGLARSPIDYFVLARQQTRGISMSGPARRTSLLRRVYLDMLGVPPTPEQVASFVEDDRPDAYERMIEGVLASPHYGERWGRHWLDLARYADSDGYEKDRARPFAWRYRQWVVDALNADLSFDEFSRRQLAGDLLPDRSSEHLVASGFHRNTLHNTEGGTDPKEDFFKKTVDRTNTLGTIWLGLTVGCAQCHTHKYDPLTQREYYQLFAFFNSIDEKDVTAPTTRQRKDFERATRAFVLKRDPLAQALAEYRRKKIPAAQAAWEKTATTIPQTWHTLPVKSAKSKNGATLKEQKDRSWLATGKNVTSDLYTLEATSPLPSLSGLRLEVLTDKSLAKNGPGRAKNGNFVLANIHLHLVDDKGQAKPLAFKSGKATFAQKGFSAAAAISSSAENGWAISPQIGKRNVAVFELAQTLQVSAGQKLRVTLDQAYKGETHNLGRFRLSVTSQSQPGFDDKFSTAVASALRIPAAKRSAQQQKVIGEYYLTQDSGYQSLKQKLDAVVRTEPKLAGGKAQAVNESAKERPTKMHIRGEYLRTGDAVQRKGPEVLPPIKPRAKQLDRLDLAEWLLDPQHPLPARVTANRIWYRIFGRGIVATVDDFGAQGERPSHPQLLDWMASELIRSRWSLKHLHRMILKSATYRQSSDARPDLREIDPENIYLARQNRRRVEAEIVRDLALTASGLLDPRVGGPAVRPSQPSEYSRLTYANSAKWKVSAGGDAYRRGLYTFFQRTSPYPMLMTFDSPDSNTCAAARSSSNTPIQALTLWNDPVFFEAAQAMARRILSWDSTTAEDQTLDQARMKRLFVIALSRPPGSEELAALNELLVVQKNLATANSKAAKQIVGKLPVPSGADSAEVAAWTIVCRTLLNLDEFITRE